MNPTDKLLNTDELRTRLKIDELTPVEEYDGIYYKRDDYYRPFDDVPLSGGKVRQACSLMLDNYEYIKNECNGLVATANTTTSPQGIIVARVAKEFGFQSLILYGSTKKRSIEDVIERHPLIAYTAYIGAKINIEARQGFDHVVHSLLKRQIEDGFTCFDVKFGINLKSNPDAIIKAIGSQVQNIPNDLDILIIPCGSCITAGGIMWGLKHYNKTPKMTYLIQVAGYDRDDTLNDIFTTMGIDFPKSEYELIPDKTYKYDKLVRLPFGGGYLDPIYEGKAFDYMNKHIDIKGKKVLFWIVGDSQDMRDCAEKYHKEYMKSVDFMSSEYKFGDTVELNPIEEVTETMKTEENVNNAELAKVYDIEDAPDDFDLDSLLSGMDKAKRGANSKQKARLSNLADTLKSDYPSFTVELSKLMPVLKVASLIAVAKGKNLFAKAVGFKADAKTHMLKVYSSDGTKYFSYEIPLFRMDKNDKVCTSYFAVSYDVLNKLIMACDGVVSVYKKNSKFYFRLAEGDIEIETMGAQEVLQICKEQPDTTHESINKAFLQTVLQTLYPYACLGINNHQKRIYVIDNAFYAQFMFSCARITSSQKIPNMDLPVQEMKILYTIMNAISDTQLAVKSIGKRIFFEGEHFIFSTMIVDERIAQELIDSMDGLVFTPQHQSATVSTVSIAKIADLAEMLMYSIHRLQFNYSDNNTLIATMLTKRENSVFTIGKVTNGVDIVPLQAPIVVQSALLQGLAKLYRNCDDVNFYVTPHGLGVKQSITGSTIISIESVLYTEQVITDLNKKAT